MSHKLKAHEFLHIQEHLRSEAVVANSQIDLLRVENLSRADRRRLELSLPIAEKIPAEKLRSASAHKAASAHLTAPR